jgi:hypothetical protein
MPAPADLHRLLDELPPERLADARRVLEALTDASGPDAGAQAARARGLAALEQLDALVARLPPADAVRAAEESRLELDERPSLP